MELRSGNAVPAPEANQEEAPYVHPKCTKHPRGGVMCATCYRAGKTDEQIRAYQAANPRHAHPRMSSGGKAPRQMLAKPSFDPPE
jgi:hypothetical protein